MIYLTGSSDFVGNYFLNCFKRDNVRVSSRGKESKIDDVEVVIHLAGKAHDLKNTSPLKEYYEVKSELSQKVYDAFLASGAKVFITLSSVKAVADEVSGELTEQHQPNPMTHYGKSKLFAEQFILSKEIPQNKSVYILRLCMFNGPGNMGNLNLLFTFVSKGFPWPLGVYENPQSYPSIENLCFVIKELIEREDILSGIYNVADDEPLTTNELIGLIALSQKKSTIWEISNRFIEGVAWIGDRLNLPLNSERFNILTSSYVVSNTKIKAAIAKPLPVSNR